VTDPQPTRDRECEACGVEWSAQQHGDYCPACGACWGSSLDEPAVGGFDVVLSETQMLKPSQMGELYSADISANTEAQRQLEKRRLFGERYGMQPDKLTRVAMADSVHAGLRPGESTAFGTLYGTHPGDVLASNQAAVYALLTEGRTTAAPCWGAPLADVLVVSPPADEKPDDA